MKNYVFQILDSFRAFGGGGQEPLGAMTLLKIGSYSISGYCGTITSEAVIFVQVVEP